MAITHFMTVRRPADMDSALDGSLMIGVPAGNFSSPGGGLSYYLVMLKPAGEALGGALQLPFQGLQLGQQLGQGEAFWLLDALQTVMHLITACAHSQSSQARPQSDLSSFQVRCSFGSHDVLRAGSYGRVYRGTYKGQRVAVKVSSPACTFDLRGSLAILPARLLEAQSMMRLAPPVQVIEDASRVRKLGDGRPVEEGISHPNLVKAYAHNSVPAQPQGRASLDAGSAPRGSHGSSQGVAPGRWPRSCDGGAEGKRAAPELEMWLVLEYCDKGCLQVCQ